MISSGCSQRVSNALEESVAVAEAYLAEHKEIIKADVLAMANDLSKDSYLLATNPSRFGQLVSAQASLRSLTESVVFQRNKILSRSGLSFALMFELDKISSDYLKRAANGEVVILTSDNDDKVRALVKLDNLFDTYLLVGRFVDSRVVAHTESAKGSVNEYKKLKSDISKLQIKFSFVFIGVALLILLSSVWFGLIIASDLVKPINNLVIATERIKEGDLNIKVDEGPDNDEIGTLGRAFNGMADQLGKQRNQLIEVNRQIDERRRFSEAVLSGVSAGIIALDKNKNVTLFNKSALGLLFIQNNIEIGSSNFKDFFPEIESLIDEADRLMDTVQKEITITRNQNKSTFMVRVTLQELAERIEGYIITFDDITELKSAERGAAWADVARRIAHEIKNPLTPIHLSAERLRKKYISEIQTDPSFFNKYIDTIIKHVGDIGEMVEEFSEFARMPSPVFSDNDICEIIRSFGFFTKEC